MTSAQRLYTTARTLRGASLLVGLLFSAAVAAQDDADGETAPAPTEVPQESAQPAPEPPRYASRRERDRELLAERFPDEARWLTVPEPEARTLALHRPALAEPKGALLLFHGAENPPHWPPPLANLRRALPRLGWATFAMTLPVPAPPPVPPRPDPAPPPPPEQEADNAENGAAQPTEAAAKPTGDTEVAGEAAAGPGDEEAPPPLPPRAERIAYQVDAGLQWLAENGQGNLVLLLDPLSAPAVMTHLQPRLEASAQRPAPGSGDSPLPGPIRALILVNRAHSVELDQDQLSRIFAVPELPVLDVFIGPAARVRERQQRHRDMARRQRLAQYHSLATGAPDVRDPDNERSFWVRRIQAFMQRQAEGVEVRLTR